MTQTQTQQTEKKRAKYHIKLTLLPHTRAVSSHSSPKSLGYLWPASTSSGLCVPQCTSCRGAPARTSRPVESARCAGSGVTTSHTADVMNNMKKSWEKLEEVHAFV